MRRLMTFAVACVLALAVVPIAVSLSLDEELTGLPMRRKAFAGQSCRGQGFANATP